MARTEIEEAIKLDPGRNQNLRETCRRAEISLAVLHPGAPKLLNEQPPCHLLLCYLREHPQNWEGSYNNLGVLALEENRGQLAATFFAKALQQNPRDAKTHYLLARSQLSTGDFDGAKTEIEEALRLEPRQPEFQDFKKDLEKKAHAP